ncbi:hypothetical protein HMPREF9099_01621 [Lachnospiraceae bacterium oral taxon 082 str. F0431]|nr:hypothetical protein HMPREF9099_01621 [Lachnospiraceae bacterium oral taxon 082 str. F0431]
MRKQTEQQIQKNKIAGYGYIDKRGCQKAVSFGFMPSVWVKEVISGFSSCS